MSEELHGKIEIKDPGHLQNTVISLDGSNGDVFIGGPPGGFGHRGRLIISDKDGNETFSIDGQNGELNLEGDLCVKDDIGNKRVCIKGHEAEIVITSADGQQVLRLGAFGNVIAGGAGLDGDLILRSKDGQDVFQLGADEQNLIIKKPNGERVVELGKEGNLYLGGGGESGDIVVRTGDGDITIRLDGQTGNLNIGASGQAGDVFVNNPAGDDTIHLDGSNGNTRFNGTVTVKQDLTVSEKTTTKDLTVTGKADLQQGLDTTDLTAKNITVTNSSGTPTIKLLGGEGDIQLLNADYAEDFDIVETEEIGPGTVMVLNQEGRLCSSSIAYDKKVTGIISGAGDYKAGLVLDKQSGKGKRMPIALMGKVYCKVDADYSPIQVGDLLTTSATPGYAMKADDPFKAFGAVIGKALRPLQVGQGLIPVIVALQ